MHFVIVGCGAVGGYFGGRLAQYGENVTFVARGQQFLDLQSSGLSINSIEGDIHLEHVNVVDAQTLNTTSLTMPADVIFLCVKSYQLVTAIKQIKPLINTHTRVVSLLNGVNAADVIQKNGIERKNIIGGLAKIIADKTVEGVINHTGAKPHITLGALPNNNLAPEQKTQEIEVISAIAKSLTLSGISVGVTSDIALALWRKYIFVAAWGALAAAKKLTLGEILSQSHIQFLLERLVHEYANIAVKLGVDIKDKHINETLTFLRRLPATSETSMQRDIAAGHDSEFDILVAYAKMQADKYSISAPVLKQCYDKLIIE